MWHSYRGETVHEEMESRRLIVQLSVFGVLLVLASKGIADDKSDLNRLVTEFYEWRLADNPEFATQSGDSRYDDQLENLTIADFEMRKTKCQNYLLRLGKIDRAKLGESDQLNYDVMRRFVQALVDGYEWHLYNSLNPVNFLEGPHIDLEYLVSSLPFKTKKNYENYLTRLELLPSRLSQMVALMRKAIELGRTNHRVSMDKIPGQISEGITNLSAVETFFYTPFKDALTNLSIPEDEKSQLRARGQNVIANGIQPAFANLSMFIADEYLPNTRSGYGVSSYDRGSDYYKACLKWHLTTDMTPEEVHEKGWSEIRRISAEMNKILADLKFRGSIRDFVNSLKTDPRFFYNTSDELLAEYNVITRELIPQHLPKVFKDIPVIPFEIRAMTNDGPLGQYYDPGQNNSRPGVFEVNLYNPKTKLTVEMVALSLHEVEPGHHYQASVQITEHLPDYRKNLEYSKYYAIPFNFPFQTAYSEGWALYAEALGEEMGVYRNNYELFGRYSSEIFRACRLVADTGLHYFNWTRERAIELFENYTANSLDGIKIEVDRYITWPGQACAYKIGELKIKDLRKKASDALGSNFDLKEFHNRILKTGPVPLSILETVIDRYIRESRPTSSASTTSVGTTTIAILVLCHLFNQFAAPKG